MIRTRTDGFSLIELMIVVGVIAVLGGMAVPQIAGAMRQYSLTSASQQVVSTVRAARAQAVGRNARMRVRFNFPAARQYQVWRLDPALGWLAAGGVNTLPNGASFGAVSDIIEIDTSGRVAGVAGPAPVTIVVTNGTQNRTITASASGRVQLS